MHKILKDEAKQKYLPKQLRLQLMSTVLILTNWKQWTKNFEVLFCKQHSDNNFIIKLHSSRTNPSLGLHRGNKPKEKKKEWKQNKQKRRKRKKKSHLAVAVLKSPFVYFKTTFFAACLKISELYCQVSSATEDKGKCSLRV